MMCSISQLTLSLKSVKDKVEQFVDKGNFGKFPV